MIIYFIFSSIARIFMPHDAVLVNQKLQGFWQVVEDNRNDSLGVTDSLLVVRFNKCKSKDRKKHHCTYSWTIIDPQAVTRNKLNKEVKKNWEPDVTKSYWIEKKKDRETKREIIHIEDFNEISINLIKKEIEFYSKEVMLLKIRKLK